MEGSDVPEVRVEEALVARLEVWFLYASDAAAEQGRRGAGGGGGLVDPHN